MSEERNYVAIMHQYCDDVKKGKRVAGEFERLAVKRFLNDLKRQTSDTEFNYRLSTNRVDHACYFIESLHHVTGSLARTNFILDPWQIFVVGNIFGWENDQGIRRFIRAYIEIAKKNGKSTLASAIGLYMLIADGEAGAEVYSAASNYDQAKIVWEAAKQMVKVNEDLQEDFGVDFTQYAIRVQEENSVFRPLATDNEGSKDGKNVHCGILDEIHAHKSSYTYDIISDGIIARAEPLILGITTAGHNKSGVCWRERSKIVDTLRNKVKLERYFGIIFTLDRNDDWKDPAVWVKANPSMGIAFDNNYLKDKFAEISITPSEESRFRQKSLNQWVQSADSWIPAIVWENIADTSLKESDFKGVVALGGGDLASKLDLAGFVKWYPKLVNGKVHWYLFCRQYINEFVLNQRKAINGEKRPDDYLDWEKDGWLIKTPGNTTDFNIIQRDVIESHETSQFYEFGYDPFNASQFGQNLIEKDINAVEVPQRVQFMSPAMRWIEELLRDGRLHHDGNPVLQWCVCNIEVCPDRNENIFPRKPSPERKIDAGVAMINGASRAMYFDDESVFELIPGEDNDNWDVDDYLANMVVVRR